MPGRIAKIVVVIIALNVVITSCNSATSPQISFTPTPLSETALPSVELTATPIVHLSTFTPAIKPTSTVQTLSIETPIAIDGPRIRAQCLEVSPQMPVKNLGNGKVVIDTFATGYFLWNFQTGEKLSLEVDDDFLSMRGAVSPNHSLLALEQFVSGNDHHTQISIMDSNGQVIKTLGGDYLQANNLAWAWLNDQQLIFNITFLYPETPGYDNLQQFLVLDAFTGQQQHLVADFPNSNDGFGIASWDFPWNQSRVAYNSILSHAVYLGKNAVSYELWDFNKGKSAANLLSLQGHAGPPRWSPDGSKFLLLGFIGDVSDPPAEFDYHLYLVETNGTLTALDDNLDWNFDGHSWSPSYDGYFWSPSGRYIALFLYQEDYLDRLVVLDTQTMIFTDYCISFRPVGEFITLPPVWSPDESQLILEDRISQPGEGNHSMLILVDFAKGKAVQIAEDTQVKGWMTNLP